MKLKFKTMLLLCLAGCINTYGQTDFKIMGVVKNMADGTKIKLTRIEGAEPKELGETESMGGQFLLQGTADRPYMCMIDISVPGKGMFDHHKATLRIMLDNKPVIIKTDTLTLYADKPIKQKEADVKIQGGEISSQYTDFLNFTRQADCTADSASRAAATAWFEHNANDDAVKDYNDRSRAADKALAERQEEYFKTHPNTYPTAAMMAMRIYQGFTYTTEDYDRGVELLKNNPDTAHVNFYNRYLGYAKQFALGVKYTDFTAKKKDNTMAKLSAQMQAGKYTLIDFWASWCGPCRKAIPKVKGLAAQYKDKLAVVSVSLDEKEDAWRKAEKEEGMTWPQLLLLKKDMGNVCGAYKITTIPRLVLINPEGKIVLSTHDTQILGEKLKELLSK